jgi:CRISPR-associated RAMP protein (TIGR02581 family)
MDYLDEEERFMLKKLINECTVKLKLKTVDPLLIKSGVATLSGPNMAFVVTYRNGQREPYLPGSSLKGVIRSHAERIARTLKSPSACEPFWNDEIEKEVKRNQERAETIWCGERFKRREKKLHQQINNETAYKDSCPACRLFGSTYYAGRFSISDGYLIEELRQRRPQQRDGVGIDRFTGGASKRAKFDLEVLSEATFECTIRVRNFELWQLGWLAYVIQDLKDEMIHIGSGKSRGLGRVRGEIESVTVGYLVARDEQLKNSNGQFLLRGIGSMTADSKYGFAKNDEMLLPEGFSFVRPDGKLKFECRFEQGQDFALWLACADKWNEYIEAYKVAPDMLHTKFMNAPTRDEDDD